MKILEVLLKEIALTPFEYVNPVGRICELTLKDGNVTGDTNDPPLQEFTVGEREGVLHLSLWRGAELAARLNLTYQGVWKGRDRRSKGIILLTPQTQNIQLWRALSNPRTFETGLREQTVKLSEHRKPAENTLPKFKREEQAPTPIDWSDYDYDLSKSLDKSKLYQSDTAIALVACDRPTYFEQMVESLATNEVTKTMPIFLFMDRKEHDHLESDWEMQTDILRTHFPYAPIIRRPRNFGCGRNIIDARYQLFNNMKYEQVFVFEDDMIVSPDYVELCLNLMKWANTNYSNVGAVQAWNKNSDEKELKLRKAAEVHATYTNWWGYLMKREAWMAIQDEILEFQNMFLQGSYAARPHKDIFRYFQQKRAGKMAQIGDKPFPADKISATHALRYFDSPPTGQDAATMLFFEQAGFVRLATTVNRSRYIGQSGIHMTPRQFHGDGLHLVKLDEIPDDSNRLDFAPRHTGGPAEKPKKGKGRKVKKDASVPKGINKVEG